MDGLPIRKSVQSSNLVRLFRHLYENAITSFQPIECHDDRPPPSRNQGWILRPGCALPTTALETCPPTPVEVLYALRVLAERGRFGR